MARSAQQTRRSAAHGMSDGAAATILRDGVAEALERLSQLLMAHTAREVSVAEPDQASPGMKDVQETVRFLGQVIAAWAEIPDDALSPRGAGFGSTVVVHDLDGDVSEGFTLMAGPFVDIDAGQVSLASPIGQALLGATKGDVVSVRTPQRLRRLRVVDVVTLQNRIAEHSSIQAA